MNEEARGSHGFLFSAGESKSGILLPVSSKEIPTSKRNQHLHKPK